MNYNYHTHTSLCGHATGSMEEYIKRAIECGIRYMGFSDHIPYSFADEYAKGKRMTSHEAYGYISEAKSLKEKYKDKIDIRIGFEMEYYPERFNEMLSYAKKLGAEYLILGQHYMNGIFTGGSHVISGTDSPENLINYVDEVITAMESGVFTYVAHPDMINFVGDCELYEKEMRKLCIASERTGVPLEINAQGIVDNRIYPSERFWAIAGEVGCPVTFGFDAHSVDAVYDKDAVLEARRLIEKFNLNYIGKPFVREIQ